MDQNHDFARAYAELSQTVYRYARYKLGSKEAAEDVTAETFTRLLENPKSSKVENLKAWTLAIARNIIWGEYKQKRTVSLDFEIEETLQTGDLDGEQVTAEMM